MRQQFTAIGDQRFQGGEFRMMLMDADEFEVDIALWKDNDLTYHR